MRMMQGVPAPDMMLTHAGHQQTPIDIGEMLSAVWQAGTCSSGCVSRDNNFNTLTRSVGLAMAMARAPVVRPAATFR